MITVKVLTKEAFLEAGDHIVVPIVRLCPSLTPSVLREQNVILLALLGFYTPSQNIKFIPASYMLATALASEGCLRACMLVENSSGNFALSLAAYAHLHGLEVTAIVSNHLSPGKLVALQASGARVLKERDAVQLIGCDPRNGGAELARQVASRYGWINLGQYSSPTNPQSYATLLAPQVLAATKGKISLFATALGSTGTLIGLGGAFKREVHGLETIAVIPALGEEIPGCRDEERLREVTLEWKRYADHRIYVLRSQAFRASLELWKTGIPAGPSSGAGLFGLRKVLLHKLRDGTLDDLRGEDRSIVAMVCCADTLYPYLGEVLPYCGQPFPAIDLTARPRRHEEDASLQWTSAN